MRQPGGGVGLRGRGVMEGVRAAVVIALTVGAIAPSRSATYYVDSAGGNDGNEGISPELAWASIERANGARLNPGDHVFFKRGQTFDGTLNVDSSGATGNLIVFGAYGGGHNPVITGRDHGVTSSAGRQYIPLQEIQVGDTGKEAI